MAQIRKTRITTLFGPISFDSTNQNSDKSFVTFQFAQGGQVIFVAPFDMANADLVYPFIGWSERVYSESWYSEGYEIFVTVFTAFLLFISLIMFLVVILLMKKSPAITAASPLFCFQILLGSILLYSSVFSWQPYVTDASCLVTPWLLAIGFGLMYGALFVKNYRVYKIFVNEQLQNVSDVENKHMMVYMAAILFVEFIFLILWTTLHPMQAVMVTDDFSRVGSSSHMICRGENQNIFIILLMGYNALILCTGVILTYKIRNVERVLWNESRFIALSIYNFFVFAIIIVSLQLSGSVNSKAIFILRSLLLDACVFISVATLFGSKLLYTWQKKTPHSGTKAANLKLQKISFDQSIETMTDYSTNKDETTDLKKMTKEELILLVQNLQTKVEAKSSNILHKDTMSTPDDV